MKFNFKRNVKQRATNIVYYDSDTKVIYNNIGGNIVQYTKKADAKLRVSTLVSFDSLLKANIDVPKTIDELDIEDFIIEQTYKQLNIQSDSSYEISYFKIETNFDADHWSYDVYAIDSAYLEKNYDDLLAKTQYIDVITSTAFLPIVLYKKGKLDLIGNHIFVFIGNNSGIFAFYSKGEPVYIKTLNSNIHRLRIEFNQETSLELSSSEFENFIAGKVQEVSEHRQSIDTMLDKISRDIEENILYIKRVYSNLDPTVIYYGMSIEYDNDFLSFFRDTFLIETKPFNSLAFIETIKGSSAIADIAMYYADYYIANVDSKLPNFSYAKRPKPLNQRESGQFVLIVGGIFVLSLLYPVYNFAMAGFFSFRGDMLQKEYDNVVFPQAEEYRTREEQLKKQIENLQKQKTSVNEEIASVRNNMNDIHSWQIGYIQKSKVIDDILKVANNSRVSVVKSTAIANNNQQLIIELNLFAKTQDDITDFIKNLNEKKIYKSVVTEKVDRVNFGDENNAITSSLRNQNQQTTNIQTATTNVTQRQEDTNSTKIDSISAKIDFSENPDLGKKVNRYLNSIVKVVIR
ncbi:hypothetical protein [Helicobacter sp. MIT 14-3879]|uniref:hypothetical protein n=1 Tax=Helicobacter sp. MIT 14-3879 TaxID=2040649 RepID=UPI000E1E377A|nr:hypothetical protein [Helicobacter sp. MIT 14-3879]RDU65219.1 hypothetical protein CQA44_02585 [Helicobacter sp. MIT 14-3879]